jgi:23S rRNA G2069 N7-methylase RlmK/C1962 C5-methylase RlmI
MNVRKDGGRVRGHVGRLGTKEEKERGRFVHSQKKNETLMSLYEAGVQLLVLSTAALATSIFVSIREAIQWVGRLEKYA